MAARKTTKTTKTAKPEVKPLKIEGLYYFEMGCQHVWLDTSGDKARLNVAETPGEDYPEYEEDFEVVMVTLYELARKNGLRIPPFCPA